MAAILNIAQFAQMLNVPKVASSWFFLSRAYSTRKYKKQICPKMRLSSKGGFCRWTINRRTSNFEMLFLVQVWLRAEKYYTPCSTWQGFELMTSRSWQCISCHYNACSNQRTISDFLCRCENVVLMRYCSIDRDTFYWSFYWMFETIHFKARSPRELVVWNIRKMASYFAQRLDSLRKKATIHHVTTMLATSKMFYFQVISTC